MKTPLLALPFLATALTAQQTVTAPRGFDTADGASAVAFTQPWGSSYARFQYVDGTQRGTPLPNISQVEMRRDGLEPDGSYGARTSDVRIRMAHTSLPTVTGNFQSNYQGAATVVFTRKPVNLPDHSTAPMTAPAPWSLAFPLDVPWSYNGNADLLIEFETENTTPSGPYLLDAVDASAAGRGSFRYIDVNDKCFTINGGFDIFARDPRTSTGGTVTLENYASRAPSNAVAVAIYGSAQAIALPNLCATFRVMEFASIPYMSDPVGNIGTFSAPNSIQVPFNSPFSASVQYAAVDLLQPGIPVALSDAAEYSVVGPNSALDVRRIYTTTPGSTTGFVSDFFVPVMRLTHP